METLIKVDPEQHMYRWYSVGVQSTLGFRCGLSRLARQLAVGRPCDAGRAGQ